MMTLKTEQSMSHESFSLKASHNKKKKLSQLALFYAKALINCEQLMFISGNSSLVLFATFAGSSAEPSLEEIQCAFISTNGTKTEIQSPWHVGKMLCRYFCTLMMVWAVVPKWRKLETMTNLLKSDQPKWFQEQNKTSSGKSWGLHSGVVVGTRSSQWED